MNTLKVRTALLFLQPDRDELGEWEAWFNQPPAVPEPPPSFAERVLAAIGRLSLRLGAWLGRPIVEVWAPKEPLHHESASKTPAPAAVGSSDDSPSFADQPLAPRDVDLVPLHPAQRPAHAGTSSAARASSVR